MQPTNNENATVHRSQGRIVRTNDETNTVGGSVAVSLHDKNYIVVKMK